MYAVRKIPAVQAKEYVYKYHYSHGSHHSPLPCYGLFDGENLVGVYMFATPCSESVRASIFGIEYKNHVTELHRLHILDVTPKNTESWFISCCLHLLKQDCPQIEAVIAFSDPTEGHTGIIYQATNALYYGKSQSSTFYIDKTGRLRHPRQCGINISKEKALELEWIPTKRLPKYRYLWLLGGKTRRKTLYKMLKVKIYPYPKIMCV